MPLFRKSSLVWIFFVAACSHSAPVTTATFPERDLKLYEATARDFVIASQGEATTLAARRMFEQGGNIVDAAVAASFTIAVERPQSTGVAGGGFMVMFLPTKKVTTAADFRERAPAQAHEKMYQDAKGEVIAGKSSEGALAVGVPGMVAGNLEIHKKYGSLPLATVLAPAIELAEKGVTVYPHLAAAIEAMKETLWESEAGRALFFRGKDQPLKLGDVLKQPQLAKVLRTIAAKGRNGFYKGWVADAILKEQKRLGGWISQKDLNDYKVRFREPVKDDFGPYEILSMPPPSSGGVHVIEILNVLEEMPLAEKGAYAIDTIHATAGAMQLAYHDRAKYLGDPDFIKVPLKTLTSDVYAGELRKLLDPAKAKTFKEVAPPNAFPESSETTHFTIADKEGNVISSTQTINGWFGSGVVVPGTDIVLNNEMDDFSAKPGVANKFGLIGGKENAIAPGKRPLSSMSPTIVLENGKAVLALGSPAGSQIITCVALTAMNYLRYKMPLYEAVASMRYHHQWTPDELLVEKPGLAPEVEDALKKRGWTVKTGDIGCKVQAVAIENGQLHGVSDPRGEGLVAGEGPVAVSAKPATESHVPAD